MRKVKPLLLLAFVMGLVLASVPYARAGHCAGGEISYEWVADSTYRVYFKFFRDCSGPNVNATQDLCVINSCIPGNSFTSTMQRWVGITPGGFNNGTPVATSCPANPTQCESPLSAIPNYEEWLYSALVTLPSRCSLWKFGVWFNARNPSNNIANGNLYVEATLNNVLFQGNSSPYFTVRPAPTACINQWTTYNSGALDTNGDSVVTEIINPMSLTSCTSLPTNLTLQAATPAYAIPGNPIQTNYQFLFDPASGQINYMPTAAGPGTLTTRVKEYRKGVLVGYAMRDIQIQVSSCISAAPVINVDATTILGGGHSGNMILGCVGQQLNYCFDVEGSSNSVLAVSDNHTLSLPAANISYTHQAYDSVRGCVNWVPGLKDTGLKSIIIISKDSNCTSGIISYHSSNLSIYIWPPTQAFHDTAICPGSAVQLTTRGGGSFFWTTVSGGSGNSSLSCLNCTSPIATPTITTQYISTSFQNVYCPNNKDTVVISILPLPKFTPLKDTITCPHNPIHLNLKGNPPPGITNWYKWTPSTYLSNDTISNPIVNPLTPVTYSIVITSDQNSCIAYDTVLVDVLTGYDIKQNDTGICIEDVIIINTLGDPRYKYAWTTTSQISDISPPYTLATSIQPKNTGTYTYTITASYPGCTDSIKTFKVDVQPVPYVNLDKNFSICYGSSRQIHGDFNPSSYPYKLEWTPATHLSNNTIKNPVFKADQLGLNVLTFTAKSSAGCKASGVITINVYPAEILGLVTPDTAICGGDSIQLHLTGNGLKSFAWYPNIDIDDPRSYDPFVSPVTTRTYIASGIDSNLCTDTQEVVIVVKPAAVLDLPDSIQVYPGSPYRMHPGGNCSYFTWAPFAGLDDSTISDPYALPDTTTSFSVIASTEFGCVATDTIKVQVMPEIKILAPNAFTPTESGNNIFKPIFLGKGKLKKFTVYDRWGIRVFESGDPDAGWDGTYKGMLQPVGVYVYTLEVLSPTGKKMIKDGNVTLLR